MPGKPRRGARPAPEPGPRKEPTKPGIAPAGAARGELLRLGPVLLLALVTRAWGLGWGVPHAGRFYPYHPDETVLLAVICRGINPLWGEVTPGFYSYGTLTMALTRMLHDLFAPGVAPRWDLPDFAGWVSGLAHLLVFGRAITVAAGVGMVAAVYLLGKRLYGERAGWIAAAFLALAPMPVLLSHYLTVDIPSAFLATLALLPGATVLVESDPGRRTRAAIWSGLFAGLAIGVKYSAAPLLFPLAFAVAGPAASCRRDLRGAGIAAAGMAAAVATGFIFAVPGAALDTGRFLLDVQKELQYNREGMGLVFQATPWTPLYHLGISLPIALEWPLYLLCLAGVARAMARRKPADWFLLLLLLATFVALAPVQRKFVRYVVPLLPPLVLLAGSLVCEAVEARRGAGSRLAWTAAGLALAGAAASSTAHLGVLAAPDARDRAADLLRARVGAGETVALASDSWYYTPPIEPAAGSVKMGALFGGPPAWYRREVTSDLTPVNGYRLLAPAQNSGALSVARLREVSADWVVMTDYDFEDPERIARSDPAFHHPMIELTTELGRFYHVVAEFRPRPSLFGLTWWSHGIPPHDWRYPMPTVVVLERNRISPGPQRIPAPSPR